MSYLLEVPPPRPLPPAVREAQCRLLEDIVARRRPAWRSRFAVLSAALLLTGGGVATAVGLRYRDATDKSIARCYTSAVRADGRMFPGTSIKIANRRSSADQAEPVAGLVTDAVAQCSQLWRDGQLSSGQSAVQDQAPGEPHFVPPLVGCVLADGTAAVFPGDSDTCERLGLPEVRS